MWLASESYGLKQFNNDEDLYVTMAQSIYGKKDISKKGIDIVIDICKALNASIYINAIGGQDLYSKEAFAQNQINLKFIKSHPINYPQFNNEFVPWLSIIDIMMFNSKNEIKKMLNEYELI